MTEKFQSPQPGPCISAQPDPQRPKRPDDFCSDNACRAVGGCIRSPAVGAEPEWQAMLYAPRDGSKIELLVEHREYWIALKAGRADGYRQACEGHWVDFNGGGWSWMGTAGQPIGWRPLGTGPASDVPVQGSES